MKKLFLLALLLTQCSSPSSSEIQSTSIDVEDFDEQIIELSGLPFDIVVHSGWDLKSTSFEHQLWKSAEIQLTFEQKSAVSHIPEGSTVINSVDNPDITSFCLNESCLIQMNGEGLFKAQIFNPEGFEALKRLR